MKTLIATLLVISTIQVTAQEFNLSADNSKIEWIGYGEVGGFQQEGTIETKSGTLKLDDGKIQAAEVVINMTTINHSDKSLSKHLTNKDFFWSKKYPTATLILKSISDDIVQAELTIKGITLPIYFPIQFIKNEEHIMIKGKMTIDRTLYGIKYNSSSFFQDLGSYAIKNEFDLKFALVFE